MIWMPRGSETTKKKYNYRVHLGTHSWKMSFFSNSEMKVCMTKVAFTCSKLTPEGFWLFWKYSNYLRVITNTLLDSFNVWFGCPEASESTKKERWLPCPFGNSSLKNVSFFKFRSEIFHNKSGFSLLENVSGRSPIVLKVFHLSSSKCGHTFRCLELMIWMPRGSETTKKEI